MKAAVLSGKGGAGKTFIAVNLAASVPAQNYIDCDVEEPNGRLFLKPEIMKQSDVCTKLPAFDASKCIGCKKCVAFCQFHALIYIKEKPKVFSEVCHSCGGCMLVCPEGAITETKKQVGVVEEGISGRTNVITGILNVGEASGVPVIKDALKAGIRNEKLCAGGDALAAMGSAGDATTAMSSAGDASTAMSNSAAADLTVIDCPPGSACSVTESIKDADYCLIAAEPTAFGFHNFRMVFKLVELLGKPCGVIINKMDEPYEPLERFCAEHNVPILMRIPYDKKIAELTAKGELLAEVMPEYQKQFAGLYQQICARL